MNKKKKPHLLIVGGSGFIGYHLAIQAKKKEWKVTSISIHNPNRYRYIKGGKPQFGKIKYRKDENMKVYPNIKKAFIKLKWKPKINLDRGIKIVINSLR